ncbi:MAG: O-antigen ligase family protein [Anaerolineae bacterium]
MPQRLLSELGSWAVPLLLLAATALVGWLWLTYRPRTALTILLAGLPLHTVVFQVASAHLPELIVEPCRLWREALLLALAIGILREWRPAWRCAKRAWPAFAALAFYGVTLLVGFVRAESSLMALKGFRLAAMPLAVLALGLCLPYSLSELDKTIWVVLGVGVLVAVFALYQGYVVGPSFLWRYYEAGGRLSSSFEVAGSPVQRLMGTFSSPNQLALYLVLLILLAGTYVLTVRRGELVLFGAAALYLLVLALTVSRSGWAALAVGAASLLLLWWRRWELWVALAALVALGVGVLAQRGLLVRLPDLVSLQEISAAYHIAKGWENVQAIWHNPLGAGLGSAGALSCGAREAGLLTVRYATESFLLQIGLQQGVQGMVAFGGLICVAAWGLMRNLGTVRHPVARAVTLAALASLAGATVHAVMNVDLQDIAVQSYLWFLVAMGLRMPALETAAEEGTEGA